MYIEQMKSDENDIVLQKPWNKTTIVVDIKTSNECSAVSWVRKQINVRRKLLKETIKCDGEVPQGNN